MGRALRWWSTVFLLLLVASACAVETPDVTASMSTSASWMTDVDGDTSDSYDVAPDEADEADEADEIQPEEASEADEPVAEEEAPFTLGERLTPAPIGFEALANRGEVTGPVPIGLTIEAIDVAEAPVIPVGINAEDASMEVPPADEVGWYRFGANPGGAGSAVLAAHIAYDGRDGVFRRLAEVSPGSVVIIEFDDGSTQRWLIEEVTDYIKTELPDELFTSEGDPKLALITCGGAFNPSLRSYDSNTVAVARQLPNR